MDPNSEHKLIKVVMRHGETMQSKRRDFRWIRKANEHTEPCEWPQIDISSWVHRGGLCLNLIFWHKTDLKESETKKGEYVAIPPEPTEGHWTGYYV